MFPLTLWAYRIARAPITPTNQFDPANGTAADQPSLIRETP